MNDTAAKKRSSVEDDRIAELKRARLAALNLMEDAVKAREETERVLKQLRETEERFDIVRDGAEVGFWFCDLPFDELVWDNRVKEHFWLPPTAPVTIDTFYERLHADDRERTRIAIETSITSHNQYDIEYRTVSDNGDEKWIRAIGRTFYNDLEEPIRFDGVTLDVTSRRLAEDGLRAARDELEHRVTERTKELADANRMLSIESEERRSLAQSRADLLKQIVCVQEDERRRIARDLHDQLGQQLTALRLKLMALRTGTGIDDDEAKRVEQLQDLAEQIDSSVTFIASQLRPSALDELGLNETLKMYAEEWSRRFEVPVDFHSNVISTNRLPADVETQLYRIAQEALNNTIKHASASEVAIALEKNEKGVVLVIEDNGLGFDTSAKRTGKGGHGFGLAGMRERANLIGGALEMESKKGRGTTIYIRVPGRSLSVSEGVSAIEANGN